MKEHFEFYLSIKDKINIDEILAFYKKYPYYLWAEYD